MKDWYRLLRGTTLKACLRRRVRGDQQQLLGIRLQTICRGDVVQRLDGLQTSRLPEQQ
jgi:hypothetical protein